MAVNHPTPGRVIATQAAMGTARDSADTAIIDRFDVLQDLDRPARERRRPMTLTVDDRPGGAGRMLDRWAHLNGVEIDCSRPGKPTGNWPIEAFRSRLRAECLNAAWSLSPTDTRQRPEAWRREHDEERPHGPLRNSTPRTFAEQA